MASDMDEILKEEIREYKETLTCPSCKVFRKKSLNIIFNKDSDTHIGFNKLNQNNISSIEIVRFILDNN